jgi:hypothetical protein
MAQGLEAQDVVIQALGAVTACAQIHWVFAIIRTPLLCKYV